MPTLHFATATLATQQKTILQSLIIKGLGHLLTRKGEKE